MPRRARDASVEGATSPPAFSGRQLRHARCAVGTRRDATRVNDAREDVALAACVDDAERMLETATTTTQSGGGLYSILLLSVELRNGSSRRRASKGVREHEDVQQDDVHGE